MKVVTLVISWFLVASCVTTQPADYELNADFEKVDDGLPVGWSYTRLDTQSYRMEVDPLEHRTGLRSLRLESVTDSPRTWGTIAVQRLPVWFKMRSVILRGYVKRQNVRAGLGGLWARVEQRDGYPSFREGGDRDLPPTEDWTWYELELPIGQDAREISFGGILTGTGTLWLDSLTLDVNGLPYAEAAAQAAQTTERLLKNSLAEHLYPWPSPALIEKLRQHPLVVVRVAAPGDRASLQALQQIYRQGQFDHLLLTCSRFRPQRYLPQEPGEVLPRWPASAEWAELLREATPALQGISFDDPADLLDRVEAQGWAEGQTPHLWQRIDSLHRCLREDLGRSLVSASAVRLLQRLSDELPPPLAELAWRDLRQMEGFYRRNGSRIYLDSLAMANVTQLLQGPQPHRRALLILPTESFGQPGRDQISQLREAWGKNLFVLTLTVGQGLTLTEQGPADLADLGPQCFEYYLDRLLDGPGWVDVQQVEGWLPLNLFLRAHPQASHQQPFLTVDPAVHSDALLYLGEALPAHPYRSKVNR